MDKEFKEIIKYSLIIYLIILSIGIVLRQKEIYFGFGLGGLISVVNFLLIIRWAPAAVYGRDPKKAAFFGFFKRYFLVFMILSISSIMGFRSFMGLFPGIFLVKGIIFARTILKKNKF